MSDMSEYHEDARQKAAAALRAYWASLEHACIAMKSAHISLNYLMSLGLFDDAEDIAAGMDKAESAALAYARYIRRLEPEAAKP